MAGYRTYIIIVLMGILSLLQAMGYMADFGDKEIQTFVDVGIAFVTAILAVAGIVFNLLGRKRIRQYGR